jgi:DeoR/GlpR family transcriptional regulator of sugar metabolism
MVSPAVVCPPASIDILITDDGIAEEAIDALRRCDVRVVIA